MAETTTHAPAKGEPIRPPLKWAGSKQQLTTEIRSHFPDDYDRYHEPFVGSGAVLLAERPDQATIGDANPRLINWWEVVRDRPRDLCMLLETLPDPEDEGFFEEFDRPAYYKIRERFNSRPRGEHFDPTLEAARLQYLNRTGFNGLYRENNDGGFNVPIGQYENPDWVQAERVHATGKYLRSADVRTRCGDFSYVAREATAGDVVYFDPPYKPMPVSADFTDYTADGFGKEDQRELLALASRLADRGVRVVVSNSAVMADAYGGEGFGVRMVTADRSISSDADTRGEVEEMIAVGGPA